MKTYFPYGPPIGYAKLPDELVNDLNKGCDDIVKNKEYYQKNKESINEKRRVRREILIMMGLMRRPEPKHLPINNNTKPSFKGGNPFILKL